MGSKVTDTRNIQADIARKHLSNLIEATKIILEKHTSFEKDDSAGRMITYFIFKQLDHAVSVIKLDPCMDAVLISRTMIEGVINLSWILEKPNERVGDWFDYSSVYDFQLLEGKKNNGIFVSTEDEKKVTDNHKRNAERFLTKNGYKHHDNFRKGENLGSISNNNTDLKYFYYNYKRFSDWIHWGSQSLQQAFKEESNKLSYYESDHIYRVPALLVAFASLLNIVNKTNEHFKLQQSEVLEKTTNKMFEDLKKAGMKFND